MDSPYTIVTEPDKSERTFPDMAAIQEFVAHGWPQVVCASTSVVIADHRLIMLGVAVDDETGALLAAWFDMTDWIVILASAALTVPELKELKLPASVPTFHPRQYEHRYDLANATRSETGHWYTVYRHSERPGLWAVNWSTGRA